MEEKRDTQNAAGNDDNQSKISRDKEQNALTNNKANITNNAQFRPHSP
jgi:hypothetical protein